jgi:hypothetical protein
MTTIPVITSEMRDAINAALGHPILVVDATTQKTYYVIDSERYPDVMRDWLAHAIQLGINDHEMGRTVEWNPDLLNARGRAALGERNSS